MVTKMITDSSLDDFITHAKGGANIAIQHSARLKSFLGVPRSPNAKYDLVSMQHFTYNHL